MRLITQLFAEHIFRPVVVYFALYTHNQPSSSSSSSSSCCCSCQFAQPCANWIFQVCPIYQRLTQTNKAESRHKWNKRKLSIFLTILAGKMVMAFNFITSVFIIICFILVLLQHVVIYTHWVCVQCDHFANDVRRNEANRKKSEGEQNGQTMTFAH